MYVSMYYIIYNIYLLYNIYIMRFIRPMCLCIYVLYVCKSWMLLSMKGMVLLTKSKWFITNFVVRITNSLMEFTNSVMVITGAFVKFFISVSHETTNKG